MLLRKRLIEVKNRLIERGSAHYAKHPEGHNLCRFLEASIEK
jgi:hypothetical protein